ncbi:reverse transcriptase domain-containing protein [Tanacetum coccineum]
MKVATSFFKGKGGLKPRKKKIPPAWKHQEGGHRQNFKKGGGVRNQHKQEKRPDRTMLADSKLPTTFWAEAVNTACYVQNRVLVVKPRNKTPYELFHGRTPTLSFMRAFGCTATILNTIDHLGKFDGKADKGTQSNGFAGTKASDNAGQARKETEPVKNYILLPLWPADPPFSQDPKSSQDDGSKPSSDDGKKVVKIQEKIVKVLIKRSIELPFDLNMPALEYYSIIDSSKDDEDVGAEAEINNLDTTIQVSPIPTTRIHKDHPLDQVIGDLQSSTQTRRMSKNLEEHGFVSTIQQRTNHKDLQNCLFACFLSQEEPIFCYTKMPFGLRNAGATYQRLMDKTFHRKIGRNLEVYMDDLVIKIRTEDEVVRDIEETFKTLRKTNMKLNPKKCTFRVKEGMFLGYQVNTKGIKICPDKVDAVLSLQSPKCLKDVHKLNGKLASLNRFLAKSAEKSLPFFKTLKKCTKKSDFLWTEEAEAAFRQMKEHIAKLPMLTALEEQEELIVYLAASKEAVSAVLMTERKARQMPIYFVSRALRGPEVNYTSMEKLVLALVHASKRLRRYFQAHPIIDDSTKEEEPLPAQWTLFTDGSSCVDGCGAGVILTDPEGVEFTYALRFQFEATNNEAKYEALIAGLRIAEKIGVQSLQVNVDSKLVANQQVPRSKNKKADALSKIASTSFAHLSKHVLIEELKEKSVNESEVLAVVEEEGESWMTPIHEYLTDETLPAERKKARAIKHKSQRFAIINVILYTKSFLGPWIRCVGPSQANYVLREIHKGSCSMHAGTRSVVAKALRIGYYWPTMHKDARALIKACQEC